MLRKILYAGFIFLFVALLVSCSNKGRIPVSDAVTKDTNLNADDPVEILLSDMEISSIIEENLDALMAVGDDIFYEQEYIDANPEAFAKIVELGEAALPHLEKISEKYYTYDSLFTLQRRCFLAMMAAYKIDPSLYDTVLTSPDGKYTIKASVSTFTSLWYSLYGITYDSVNLIDNQSGESLVAYDSPCNNISFEWSPDSKYALVRERPGDGRCGSNMYIFDAVKEEYYALPYSELKTEEITNLVKESFGEEYPLYALHLWFSEWDDDGRVKIDVEFHFLSPTDAKFVRGWFIYDLDDRAIVEQEYEASETN